MDDDRPSIELSETIMQHKTANRDPDRGWVDGVPLVQVTRSPIGRIQHHYDGHAGQFCVGQEVQIKRDSEWRRLQTRLSCAARLIELVGPMVFPDLEAVGADYRLHRTKVEFGAAEFIPAPDSVLPAFCYQVERMIKLDLPIQTTANNVGEFRSIQLGDFRPFRCSAAYPTSLREIGKLIITQIQSVGGRLQVRFRVSE